MPNANAPTTPEPNATLTRDEQIRHDIADHLPTESHQALTTPQVRQMLRELGHAGKQEVSNVAARGHLLTLNREVQINRTPDGRWFGIEHPAAAAVTKSVEPIRRGGDPMRPYRPAWTEEEARTFSIS